MAGSSSLSGGKGEFMIINKRNWHGDMEEIDIPHEHLFLGECQGVGLIPRGPKDNHICFLILSEDDENWFCSNESGSSFWIPDLVKQLDQALKWMRENAVEEGFGYKFK